MVALSVAVGVCAVLQVICLGALWWVTTEVKAMQKSTHSIQYVPADQNFQDITKQVKESLEKDLFDNVQ